MKYRIFMWILWPSFLVAGLAEGLLFTLVHPEDLVFWDIQFKPLMKRFIQLVSSCFGFSWLYQAR